LQSQAKDARGREYSRKIGNEGKKKQKTTIKFFNKIHKNNQLNPFLQRFACIRISTRMDLVGSQWALTRKAPKDPEVSVASESEGVYNFFFKIYLKPPL
jgi:hypothetical protein